MYPKPSSDQDKQQANPTASSGATPYKVIYKPPPSTLDQFSATGAFASTTAPSPSTPLGPTFQPPNYSLSGVSATASTKSATGQPLFRPTIGLTLPSSTGATSPTFGFTSSAAPATAGTPTTLLASGGSSQNFVPYSQFATPSFTIGGAPSIATVNPIYQQASSIPTSSSNMIGPPPLQQPLGISKSQQEQPNPALTEPVFLEVLTEKPFYYVGDTMQARFILHLNMEPHEAAKNQILIDRIRISFLQIEHNLVDGEEVLILATRLVHDTPGTIFTSPRNYQFNLEHRLVDAQTLAAAGPSSSLVQSSHMIPISPDCNFCPQNVSKGSRKAQVVIKHSLDFLIERPGMFKKNWTCEVPVMILEAPVYKLLGFNLPYRYQGDLPYIGVMGLNRGLVGLTLATDKTHYTPGELIQVDIALDCTRAKIDIKNLSLILKRTVRIGKTIEARLENATEEHLDTVRLTESTNKFCIKSGEKSFATRLALRIPGVPILPAQMMGGTGGIPTNLEVHEVECATFRIGYEIELTFTNMMASCTHIWTIHVHNAITAQYNF